MRRSVRLIEENCEPALCTVLFMGGAGGSLRAGVVDNPVNLTRSVHALGTYVTSGGAPVYVWPGGGITFMVDVTRLPDNAFGYVPTPALVAPIEFTMRRDLYERLGGHAEAVRLARRRAGQRRRISERPQVSACAIRQPVATAAAARQLAEDAVMNGPQIAWLADGKRLHLNHGPIDLIIETFGREAERRAGL